MMLKRLVFLSVLPVVLSTSAFAQDAPLTDRGAASGFDPQRKANIGKASLSEIKCYRARVLPERP